MSLLKESIMIFRLSFLLNLLSVKIFIRPQLFVILSAVVASSVGNWPEKWRSLSSHRADKTLKLFRHLPLLPEHHQSTTEVSLSKALNPQLLTLVPTMTWQVIQGWPLSCPIVNPAFYPKSDKAAKKT